jgi:hypothetical protein
LWKYSMNVVALLRADGSREGADLLEAGVKYVTSSGWEWLGALGRAADAVSRRYRTSTNVRQALETIVRTARSRMPYNAEGAHAGKARRGPTRG